MRTYESDSRRHHQSGIPLTPAAPQHSIAPSCTCLPPQLKESSAIGRAAALTSSFLVAASSTRLSLPTSQLTASDLRVGVGPHPPTRNRTQRQASKQATCCHHTARTFHNPASSLRRPRARPSLFIPTSWTVYLAHRHFALSVVLLTAPA